MIIKKAYNMAPTVIQLGGPGGYAGNFFVFIIPYLYMAVAIVVRKIRIPPPLFLALVVGWNFTMRLAYAN